jgi:hypothetical protein
MEFLTPVDISIYIKPEYYNQITTDDNLRNMAEKIMISEVTGYLNYRYITDEIFRSYGTVSVGQYLENNDRILYNNSIYVVNSPSGVTMSTSPNTFPIAPLQSYWKTDDRPLHLVKLCVDIFIWHLITRIQPQRVEETRRLLYADALDHLLKYAKGTQTLIGAPEKEYNVGVSIIWGSDYDMIYDPNWLYVGSRENLKIPRYSTSPNPLIP